MEQSSKPQECTSILCEILGGFLAFLFVVAVALSRVVLGSHSLLQVTIGGLCGWLYADFVFLENLTSKLHIFSRMFLQNYSNKYQRKYLVVKRFLYLPIFNILLIICYLFRLSNRSGAFLEWKNAIEKSSCGEAFQAATAKTFEWKDFTDAQFVNIFLVFYLMMTALRKKAYVYNEAYWKEQTFKSVVVSNLFFLGVLVLAFAPEALLKHYRPGSDVWAVVARNGAALVFSIGLTVVVPKLNLKHRGTLKNDIV